MSENKTKPTGDDIIQFLESVENKRRKDDSFEVLKLMQEVTDKEPTLWGTSIVGFGSHHYKYESGREGDMPIVGFSPRKQSLTLYIMAGFEAYEDLMSKLGKHTTGKSCLYIKNIEDIDQDVLRKLVSLSAEHVAQTNG